MKAPGKTPPSRGGSGGSEQVGGLDDETADGILGSTLAGMVCLGGKGQHDEGSVNSGACVEATGKSAMNGRTETGPVGATEGGGLRGARISSPVDAEVSWQIEVHQNRFSSLAGAGELAAELGENHVELANPRSDSASVLSSDSQVKQREGGGLLPVPSHDWKPRRRHRAGGPVEAHARFLQWWFRASVRQRPGGWRRGGLHGLVVYRPATYFECHSGQSLAPESLFAAQRAKARAACAWYQNYVALLRRLRAGRRPTAVVGFCGQ